MSLCFSGKKAAIPEIDSSVPTTKLHCVITCDCHVSTCPPPKKNKYQQRSLHFKSRSFLSFVGEKEKAPPIKRSESQLEVNVATKPRVQQIINWQHDTCYTHMFAMCAPFMQSSGGGADVNVILSIRTCFSYNLCVTGSTVESVFFLFYP